MAYFAGRPAGRAWRQLRLDQKRGYPDWSPLVEPFSGHFPMLNDLKDRAELIEPWVGLGLTLSVFVLALLLLPL